MALVLFTGGARSGKSAAAEELARHRSLDGATVVALVFGRVDGDPEMAERIARHQAGRPAQFEVVEVSEAATAMAAIDSDSFLLVDCLGTLVGLIMAEEWPSEAHGDDVGEAVGDLAPGYRARVEERVDALVRALCDRSADTIVVTNEVGSGIVPPYGSGRLFRDVLGRANRTLASRADRSYLAVCGRLAELSALSPSPAWPED